MVDSTIVRTLLGPGPYFQPCAAVADNGYASKADRQAARNRGITPFLSAQRQ
ncbi:hypothetical protein [Mesorhizobium sp. M0633]|uniref:hypothetical protein n=1 Tax=Mesorhizobium sp. M0633 TaxID=2956977 RepID=UPI00333C35CD